MTWFKAITFAQPGLLWLLLIVPLMVIWYVLYQKKSYGAMSVSSVAHFMTHKSWKTSLRHFGPFWRCIGVVCLIRALARPQSSLSWKDSTTEGIEIMIATDISGSMLAEDFKPNRLEAGKSIAIDFIKNRPNDRIGLVVFSGESFTQCPLTIDHSVLIDVFKGVKNGIINDGTAIGMGLATAINRLKSSAAKSKVVILLTDGANNAGAITPLTAAAIAKRFKIRVYTIGIGTNGYAPFPFKTSSGVQYQNMKADVDTPTLTQIANITGGKYFRATGNETLKGIYKQIDRMEKAKIDITQYHKKNDLFLPFALLAFAFFLLEFIFKYAFYRGSIT